MKIKVYGLSCPMTERTLFNVENAIIGTSTDLQVSWISDIGMMNEKIGFLPTVEINEKVKSTGHIPSVEEVKLWIEEELFEEIMQ